MSRRRTAVRSTALVLAIGAIAGVVALGTGRLPTTAAADSSSGPGASPDSGQTTAAVERRSMTIGETLGGTLGYGGERQVVNGLVGTLTSVPAEGTVLERGDRLYEVDGRRRPVLFYGSRPAWRALRSGVSNGSDVRQLERNLKALGYTRKSDHIHVNSHWDSDTTRAVKRWQKATGQHVDGIVELGEIVFLPGSMRVTDRPIDPGAAIGPGTPVLTGTTDERAVTVELAADRTDLVAVGDEVSIELPDGSTTKGVVEVVGTVATAATDEFGRQGKPTVEVTITLSDPAASAAYANAPVDVRIVRESRSDVLAVPVNALLALLEGGYAVEVAAADGTTHLVGVETGIFEDGWVELTGPQDSLSAGDRVVVPS